MRKDSTPQVETREISDSDLDNVSGGVGAGGGVSLAGLDIAGGVSIDGVTDLVSTATSLAPVGLVGLSSPTGSVHGGAGI
ncbi:hypothetical protein [Streptomyces sp.]|uniref:hypothetical protein n=1 Tax=Streptomyces sp. TaxID=1931 RepID=UPI002F3F44F1